MRPVTWNGRRRLARECDTAPLSGPLMSRTGLVCRSSHRPLLGLSPGTRKTGRRLRTASRRAAPPKGQAIRRFALVGAVALVLIGVSFTFSSAAAAVSVTVPYSGTGIADADLDGYPGTGSWGSFLSNAVPLENGANAPYGTATLYAKHDDTWAYFRIDGKIDIPWTSATGDHFWFGIIFTPSGTSHHAPSGIWDGVFFGLWDGTDYSPQPTYPPSPIDTNGFNKPPAKDPTQDATGAMRYSGSSAPYDFTAEWKKRLNTGNGDDIAYAADGATTYNFFVTTDSNGGASSGGGITHKGATNLNTVKFASSSVAIPEFPTTVGMLVAVLGTFGIVTAAARRRSRR